ncbi:MAG: hypothetical protein WEB87_03100 [Bacteriovoracaceae bacterium]
MNYFSSAFWAIILFTLNLQAKVEPPNYDFSLDQLAVFMPGKKLVKIQEKHGQGEMIKRDGAFAVHKFYVAHIRYKFPVLVQIKNDEVTDFYARLPAYFLHDIFHQSLINRLEAQDAYYKVEEQAVYVWKNRDKLRHIYSGACSITCFPIYYAVLPEKPEKGLVPLIQSMHEQAEPKLSKD